MVAERHLPLDRDDQVGRVGVQGGEPEPVTQVEGGASSYDLAPASARLFYVVNAAAAEDDAFAKLRAEYKTLKYHRGHRQVSEVRRMDLPTWRADKMIAEDRFVGSFAVNADGRRSAVVSAIAAADEGRTLIQTALMSAADLRVTEAELKVALAPLSPAYRTRAIAGLCKELNRIAVRFPGSCLRRC